MEIELKLAIAPEQAARLGRHPALAGVKPQRRRLYSVYLDTPAGDLRARGIALRLRRVGRRWVQTLKAETLLVGALARRPEWEVGLPRGSHDLTRFPSEARVMLDALAREGIDLALIGPVFVTDFRRTTWHLMRAGAELELALDVGEIRAGERVEALSEIEIELISGRGTALFDLALELLERLPLGVEPRSKALRGDVLTGASVPAPVKAPAADLRRRDRDLDAGLLWARLAESALAHAVANVPGFLARPEDIEYLHQLRVGLRRLHGVARLAAHLGRPQPAWDETLRTLLSSLSAARDWDVLLHETLPALAEAPSPELLRRLRRNATGARRRAQAALRDPAFTRLVLEVGRDLLAAKPSGQHARDWARACLQAAWDEMRARGKGFARLDAAARHRLRIAVKHLRYAAELLAPLFARGKGLRATLARLQARLGMEQDRVSALRLLGGLRGRSAEVARLVAELEVKDRRRGGKAWRELGRGRTFWSGRA